jgi:hypothetical protein
MVHCVLGLGAPVRAPLNVDTGVVLLAAFGVTLSVLGGSAYMSGWPLVKATALMVSPLTTLALRRPTQP